jgi:dTDP-3-amino-3,4,6-trideoxy-alpha-D-glucose transaminase
MSFASLDQHADARPRPDAGHEPSHGAVPFMDLARAHGPSRAALAAAFDRVLDTSGFILGSEVESFEAEFAAHCGAAHCVGVASGTAALTIALEAAGVGPGDEVIVPAHTYIASALAVSRAGATPVFCDVDAGTGLIDCRSAAQAITDRTAALLPVHLYGQPCGMDAVRSLAREHGLAVIEDCAQAHGAHDGEDRVGTLGTAAAFSFYPSKNLGALGDGGAIATDDGALAQRAREIRNLGQRAKGEHVRIGANERLDGLQAALLRVKLPHLDGWNRRRREHAERYRALLGDTVGLLEERPGAECVYHLFPVRVADRDAVADRLRDRGVQTGVHYAPALRDQPPFAATPGHTATPNADAWAREELSLPMFPELEPFEIDHVAAALTHALTTAGDNR